MELSRKGGRELKNRDGMDRRRKGGSWNKGRKKGR